MHHIARKSYVLTKWIFTLVGIVICARNKPLRHVVVPPPPRSMSSQHGESIEAPRTTLALEHQETSDTLGGRQHSGKLIQTKYWCTACRAGFNTKKQYDEHIKSKRHAFIEGTAEASWEAWHSSKWFDANVSRDVVVSGFSLNEFLHGLKRRSAGNGKGNSVEQLLRGDSMEGQISPSVMVNTLSGDKRAQLWRYFWEMTLKNDLVQRAVNVDASLPERVWGIESRFCRLKELLESFEIFVLLKKRLERGIFGNITTIYDVACGHGLVGLLLAYQFPQCKLVSVDRMRRPAYDSWVRELGVDVEFIEGDFQDTVAERVEEDSLVLCIHGCNEINRDSLRIAQTSNASWVLAPCCLQTKHYLHTPWIALDDDTRYKMLCGAIAAQSNALFLTAIDSRTTGRGIVIGGVSRGTPVPMFYQDAIVTESKGEGKKKKKKIRISAPSTSGRFWDKKKQTEDRNEVGDETYTGTIQRYSVRYGYGFISPDNPYGLPQKVKNALENEVSAAKENGKNLTFNASHSSIYFRKPDVNNEDVVKLSTGVACSFRLYVDNKGAGAKDVKLI